MGISRELPDRSDNDRSLGTELLESLRFPLLPSMGAWLQEVFIMTNIVKLLVFKTTAELERGRWDYRKAKRQAHCFFCNLAFFFFSINAPQIFASFWLISKVLKS